MKDNEWILQNILNYFESDEWWSHVLDFMLSHCENFTHRSYYSNEEYEIYNEYINFIEDVLNNYLSDEMNISTDYFEQIVIEEIENNNEKAITLKQSLLRTADFQSFVLTMIDHNDRIEKEVETVLTTNNPNNEEHEESLNEPEQPKIHEPLQIQAPHMPIHPQLPHLDLKIAKNPRFFNRAQHSNPQMSVNPPHRPLIVNPNLPTAILIRKKENAQSARARLPPLQNLTPKLGPKLPSLSKTPRLPAI